LELNKQSDWVARSLRSVWHPCTQMQHHETVPLIPVSRGKGAWLYDHEGRRYLDAISSWWVNLFGHANPRINAALKDQLDTLEHAMLAGFTHEPVIELSEKLSALTGHVLGHSFYASDGASAVEIALKMSFHSWRNHGHTDKQEFVCLKGSYHGETIGALAVTDVALFKDAYGPLLRASQTVMSPDARTAAEGETAPTWPAAPPPMSNACSSNGDKIAAIIIEPLVQCATGMAMHDPLYLQLVRALCDQHKVHLILDEIAVGCGRTGTFFACEQAGLAGLPVPVERHQRRLPAAVAGDDARRNLPGLLQQRRHARLPALALVHRQSAGLPRRAGDAANLRRRRCAERQPRKAERLTKALQPLAQHDKCATSASAA
jgi:adenosylmethionine-8-amino-7-oxononanoate aminotransferase